MCIAVGWRRALEVVCGRRPAEAEDGLRTVASRLRIAAGPARDRSRDRPATRRGPISSAQRAQEHRPPASPPENAANSGAAASGQQRHQPRLGHGRPGRAEVVLVHAAPERRHHHQVGVGLADAQGEHRGVRQPRPTVPQVPPLVSAELVHAEVGRHHQLAVVDQRPVGGHVGEVAGDVGEVVAVVVRHEHVPGADVAGVVAERARRDPATPVAAHGDVHGVRVARVDLRRGDVALRQLAVGRAAVAAVVEPRSASRCRCRSAAGWRRRRWWRGHCGRAGRR